MSVIDLATNLRTADIDVGCCRPWGVAVNPAGTRAYVTNNFSNTVSVIDLATNRVTATIAVGVTPFGVAVNPAGTFAYITNRGAADVTGPNGGNSVSVIDLADNRVTATIAVGSDPRGVAVNPAGTFAYVTNYDSGTVSVIAL